MCIALTNTKPFPKGCPAEVEYGCLFDNIIKPSMKISWEQKKQKWFCMVDKGETPEQFRLWAINQRTPGLLKRKL